MIVAVLAIGLAITLAWLSSFPGYESRLASLEYRFWVFLIMGLIALSVAAGAILRWVRRENCRTARDGTASPGEP